MPKTLQLFMLMLMKENLSWYRLWMHKKLQCSNSTRKKNKTI